MKLRDKAGYILWDSIVALAVFSIMLMIYLPAYYQEISRMRQIQEETEQWRIFAQLSLLESHSVLSDEEKQEVYQQMIEQSQYDPISYYWAHDEAYIEFSQGELKHVYKISQ